MRIIACQGITALGFACLWVAFLPTWASAQWEGYEIVVVGNKIYQGEDMGLVEAACPVGKVVINGGWRYDSHHPDFEDVIYTVEQYPSIGSSTMGSRWTVVFKLKTGAPRRYDIYGYAICVNAQQGGGGSATPTSAYLTSGISGKWRIEKLGQKYQIEITSQGGKQFTGKYSNITNPSTFSGTLQTDVNGVISIQFTQADTRSAYTATHTGILVAKDRFEGTFTDTSGQTGAKFVLSR